MDTRRRAVRRLSPPLPQPASRGCARLSAGAADDFRRPTSTTPHGEEQRGQKARGWPRGRLGRRTSGHEAPSSVGRGGGWRQRGAEGRIVAARRGVALPCCGGACGPKFGLPVLCTEVWAGRYVLRRRAGRLHRGGHGTAVPRRCERESVCVWLRSCDAACGPHLWASGTVLGAMRAGRLWVPRLPEIC